MAQTPRNHPPIEAALLDFQRQPGRHLVALRQPVALFDAMKDVLQIAAGRAAHEGDAHPTPAIVGAACFFVRSALLYPGASHYALLGAPRGATAALLKDRYRQLMRLMHPDFAAQGSAHPWPADAATRVNRAYEVLSTPERRKAYDEEQQGPAKAAPRVPPVARASLPAIARQPAQDPRRGLRWLAAGFGLAGGLAVVGAWLASGEPERDMLVQRAGASRPQLAKASPSPQADSSGAAPLEQPAALVPTDSTQAQVLSLAAPDAAGAVTSVPPDPARRDAPAALIAPASSRASELLVPAPATMQASMPTPAPPAAPSALAAPPAPTITPTAHQTPGPPPVQAPPLALALALAVPAPAPSAPHSLAPRPATNVPTMADVHQPLMRLLQQIESGWGDRVLSALDRDARGAPGAQALLLHYNSLVDGARPVRISSVDFKGQARDDRLLVTGRVVLEVRDAAAPSRPLALQAEFVSRNGTPVLTRLSRVAE